MTLEEHYQKIELCVYKDEKDCTQEDREVRYFERQLCNKSFPRFLHWCKIVEAPDPLSPDSSGGVIPLELWPHIKEIIRALLTERLISILKSRQIGASWLVAAYVLWFAMSHHGAAILLFSKGEVEAVELLSKCTRIYKYLPAYFRFTVMKPDSGEHIGFPVMDSFIKVQPSTETAGISFNASILVFDEHEEHPYAGKNYGHAKPTIDAGGQLISIFTVNKTKAKTLAKGLFKGAKGNKFVTVEGDGNGFYPMFFPYWVRPGRDEAWYAKKMTETTTDELEGLTPELYMEQNYPRSVDEALSASQATCAFKVGAINEMLRDIEERPRITRIHEGIDTKVTNVYMDYHVGDAYIVGTDTSHGKGLDFAVTAVVNIKTGNVVADIFSNKIEPEEVAYQSVKLLEIYRNPLWFIETNDWGEMTLRKAQELGYKKLGGTKDGKGKVSLGFRTSPGAGNRTLLWGELITAMNDGMITVYNKEGLRQFLQVIRNDEGRVGAMQGGHDDYPMAVGLAWLKREEVSIAPVSYKAISSLTFRR